MTGLHAAVDRLDAAIERKEPMLIYGDYDVDGTMAVIILKTAIELRGGTADFHVPHRIREGYDMRDDVIERAAAAGIRLIISVDMGIRAFGPAETAHRLGVDLIVTDHHLPGHDGVPRALAVINPNQSGCEYPYKQLCGAGVAFKLAQGLMQRRLQSKDQNKLLLSFMKVVAIATIADAVPLTGENRVFASLGLDALRRAVNPGLKALLEAAQISANRPPSSGEVGFRIAPRINAAGRMDVARDVIELFSVKDPVRALSRRQTPPTEHRPPGRRAKNPEIRATAIGRMPVNAPVSPTSRSPTSRSATHLPRPTRTVRRLRTSRTGATTSLRRASWRSSTFGINPQQPATSDDINLTVVAMVGVPLARIPLARIPLARIPLARIALDTPLARIDYRNTPLARIPLARIDVAFAPLVLIPLGVRRCRPAGFPRPARSAGCR